MLDVIKEYLVSVGFKVDNNSLNQTKQTFNETEKILGKFATTMAGRFTALTAAVTTFYAVATAATAKFANQVAQADRQVEFLAKRMYTTERNARSLSVTMKAMGMTSLEQLQDIALNPEARRQFMELRSLGMGLESAQSQQGLAYIREVNFEFQKLYVQIQYFIQKIAGAYATYIRPVIDEFKKSIAPLIKDWQKNGSKYADRIGKFLASIAQLTLSLVEALLKIGEILAKIPDWFLNITTAAIALFAILKRNLAGILIIIQDLMLLLDDLMVYFKGGNSYYGMVWEKMFHAHPENPNNFVAQNSAFNPVMPKGGEVARKGANVYHKILSVGMGWDKEWHPKGSQQGAFTFAKDLVISKPVEEFLNELSPFLKSKYRVTSGWEARGFGAKSHAGGLKFDVGLAGTDFQKRLDYLRALAQQQAMAESFVEINSANEYNKYMSILKQEGKDTSKFKYLKPISGENIDVRVKPKGDNNISINIYGGEPQKIANEVKKELAFLGIRGNQVIV